MAGLPEEYLNQFVASWKKMKGMAPINFMTESPMASSLASLTATCIVAPARGATRLLYVATWSWRATRFLSVAAWSWWATRSLSIAARCWWATRFLSVTA